MISFSTASLFFAVLIVVAPLLLRYRSRFRGIIFLVMNVSVMVLTCRSFLQLLVTAAWVLVPYFVLRFFGRWKWCKPVLVAALVVAFVYLAKYGFVFRLLHLADVLPFQILGLSYCLFREIDYTMRYEILKEEGYSLTLLDYCNYVLNFYTIMAGPILRYQEFADDFYGKNAENAASGETGYIPMTKGQLFTDLNRVVNGYLKVYVVSAILDHYAKGWFAGITEHSSLLKTIGAFCIFAFLNCWFIYFNFSGYCDIVIGAASLSGMKIAENFNKPYFATSVVEFWNRHHITLSQWIRDYIFTPVYMWLLSGPFHSKAADRKKAKNITLAAQTIALFVTFFVAGIWHGTTLDYVCYGFFQGLGIAVATIWKAKRKSILGKQKNAAYEANPAVIWISRAVTWGYICLTFTFTGYPVLSLFVK